MKMLFVVLPRRDWNGRLLPLGFPHIGVAYLCAYLKKHGVDVYAYDLSLDLADWRVRLGKVINEVHPDLVGMTVYSSLAAFAHEVFKEIRRHTTALVVAGGPHITIDGVAYLRNTGIDLGVMMDGSEPLLRLLEDKTPLYCIKGLLYHNRSEVFAVPPAPPPDLDIVPPPDWTVFECHRYANWRDGRYHLLTSRGCPYACTYCAAPLTTGRKWYPRSATRVVDEIEMYANKGFTYFGIMDDAWNVDIERAKEICRQILERSIHVRWDAGNGMRADRIDPELCALMRESGCTFVGIGMESGNPLMLQKIRKHLTVNQVWEAVEMLRDAKIGVAVNFIIGHPGETADTATDTIRQAATIPADYVNVYGLVPYKGTEAYNQLERGRARFLYDYDYYLEHFSAQTTEPIFDTPEFPAAARRRFLQQGRNLTKRTALRYRFGPVVGWLVYQVVRYEWIFTLFHRLRETAVGRRVYEAIRHEGGKRK